jgi:hypothetical protein
MNSDSRWYKSYRISRTSYDASRWGLWFNGQLLCDSYSSVEEAALAANKKDFDSDDVVRICSGNYVPSDINMWQTSAPRVPVIALQDNAPAGCKSRIRQATSTRLKYD